MARIIQAFTQFFDNAGDPLVNGKLKFLESGTNNTDKNTFADSAMVIPNSNPVRLDGSGRCPNVFGSGVYNVISFTSDDVQIQQFDPVGANTGTGAFDSWAATNVYSEGDIVQGDNGEYYRSLTNNNQNNNPTSSVSNWQQLYLGSIYNANVSYGLGDSAYASNGILYYSLADLNVGNNPATSAVKWIPGNSSFYAVAGGTVDAITADFPIDVAFSDGVQVVVEASGANTITNPTISVDGGAAREIVKLGNQPLDVGDIFGAGQQLILQANAANDNWELLNVAPTFTPIGVGINQSWQNLIGSRAFGVTYTNTTGSPIEVAVAGTLGLNSVFTVIIGGVTVTYGGVFSNGAWGGTFIVPDQTTYNVPAYGALSTWDELR